MLAGVTIRTVAQHELYCQKFPLADRFIDFAFPIADMHIAIGGPEFSNEVQHYDKVLATGR